MAIMKNQDTRTCHLDACMLTHMNFVLVAIHITKNSNLVDSYIK